LAGSLPSGGIGSVNTIRGLCEGFNGGRSSYSHAGMNNNIIDRFPGYVESQIVENAEEVHSIEMNQKELNKRFSSITGFIKYSN
jgi:hypothetical protein